MSYYYTAGFQCPVTGEWVIVRYEQGRVTFTASDEAEAPDTMIYCKRHTNKRVGSFEEAEEYISSVSDGQFEGLY